MAIRVALHHKTEYRYDRPVTLLPHVVRLRPAPHCRTPILGYSLRIEPEGHFLNWQQDPYSNYLARLVFLKPANYFKVTVDLIAEMVVINPFDFFIDSSAEKYPFDYDAVSRKELTPFREAAPLSPPLQKLVDEMRRTEMRTIDYLVEINTALNRKIKYIIRMEPGVQTPEETLTLGSGSCRDSAWLQVQLLRNLGFAARFVSGYLIQLKADEKSLDGPSGTEVDFTDLHAWAEVYLPGAGWIGLDATSGLLAGEGHIPLACSADPVNAAAITGSFDFAKRSEDDQVETEFKFDMKVTRVRETPRVTKPYTEEQWRAILDLGLKIDENLNRSDVRLTMGSEPTFVSIDDRDSPEWNTAALGPNKRRQAGDLFRRLRDRFAPGALLHFGQGKWYPGESLPRWALGCYWRKDNVPIWENPSLIAEDQVNYGFDFAESSRFVQLLADKLSVNPDHGIPGYEDAFYYLWRERQLPTNVDPLKSNLDDEEERKRLARIFDRGLNKVVGHTLPLRRKWVGNRLKWESGPWFLRREHLFLTPGDSPMGYRLPLDSLPWSAPEDRDFDPEFDPSVPRPALPSRSDYLRQFPRSQAFDPKSRPFLPGRGTSAEFVVRTALCVEPREGRLYVFMPPQRTTEDYLDLIAAIEATSAELKLPVQIEGYTPPSDSRLNHFSVTPDPGVIEVNIHPAHTWGELVHNTEVIYEEARQARLSTEKFMLDGRHAGTGGGNHVIVGGATPLDSPVLRRPDLLRSLVSYWHNHPSLSYLFSGLFLGPTSQAPRIDEARNDSLYELEVAFKEIPEPGGFCPPWLVDRIFRHLLTDVTGNTHRAEFCIDKLYSPDTSSGRRGLVELRAFEMPPHARMSLTQQLLLRALISRFWDQPYQQRLVRWGTELHDRFMLPHFVEQDFRDVLEDTARHGHRLPWDWFAPHLEFRFPEIGNVKEHGLQIELRTAIEPWHVLGEEGATGGTARYVDSSVERMQVKVNGMTDSRHVITCNGRKLPLHPTGTNGEYIAGVRFRAWQPPSCLHPTIGVDSPLVFDVVDTWMDRPVGGCSYHVYHPGGRGYDIFPVNANEAEGRRISRFFPFGHTPESVTVRDVPREPEAPLTLDLRKPV